MGQTINSTRWIHIRIKLDEVFVVLRHHLDGGDAKLFTLRAGLGTPTYSVGGVCILVLGPC